jgi:hypothetical protein
MRLHQVIRRIGAVLLLPVIMFVYPRLGAATTADESQRERPVTSIDISIATGELGDKDLVRGIYIYHLKCAGSCELNRITLNQCSNDKNDHSSFAPRVDNWIGHQWISAKQIGNRIELTVYQAFGRKLPAKMTWTFNSLGAGLASLSELKTAGFIDYNQFPTKVVPLEFEPVPRDRPKRFDCPVLLKGLTP